jgi:hypothetical protein
MKDIIRVLFIFTIFFIMALILTGNSSAMMVPSDITSTTTLVSAAKNGEQGNGFSGLPSISGDGRYVAFVSHSSNLIANDTNIANDIFVKDTLTGDITRVSVASDGTEANRQSWHPTSISSNGRYVAFLSTASNLVGGDTNVCPYYMQVGECPDIFVHDMQTGTTTRVSVSSDGTQANNGSYYPYISGNGQYVVFDSQATNLVPNDTNGTSDIFIHDLVTGQTALVSISSNGGQGNSESFEASVSGDGRFIAFSSYASNLTVNDTNDTYDVFIHDMQTGETSCISLAPDGRIGNGGSSSVSISYNGRYIVFGSNASNLVVNDLNDTSDIFIFDRETKLTSLVSVTQDGLQANSYSFYPFISANGRYVSFDSNADNLVSGDTNNLVDIFVRDLFTNQINRVSISSDGSQSNASCDCEKSVMSANGQFVAFPSPATNLVSEDSNEQDDIFLHNRGTGVMDKMIYLPLIKK